MRTLIFLVTCAMLQGCGDFLKKDHDDYWATEHGFRVYGIQDQGSISGGLVTLDEILETVDARVLEFIAKHPDSDTGKASKIRFYVWDDWVFTTSDGRQCTGAFTLREERIDVALYSMLESSTFPETDKPWTVHPFSGKYCYADERACPALVFELERIIGMHQDIP